MSLRHRIALPVLVLGLVALLATQWLVQGGLDRPDLHPAVAEGALAITGRLGAVAEGRRQASDIAAAFHDNNGLPDPMHRVLHDVVASVVADVEAMRLQSAGQIYEQPVERLTAEIFRWRDEVERVGHGAASKDELAAQGLVFEQLVENVAAAVTRSEAVRAAESTAAERRMLLAATVVVALAALALALVAGYLGRRLERDMALLPQQLREVAQGNPSAPLPGEPRRDEFGAMVRELRGLATTMHQISLSRAEMERMALTDPLTGLPNRRGLYDFLVGDGARRGWSGRTPLAVMHIDLDHFKAVNDINGHEIGDFVLREATRRMALVIRDSDILARVGGDEFVVFAQGVSSLASLERLAERIIRQFDAPIVFGERSLQITASIGTVLGGRRGSLLDPKRLLLNADIALAHAKAAGRGRWVLFNSTMARDARLQQEQSAEIRRGIGRGEFGIWFRPIVDVPAGRTTGLALVPRWHHPQRGVLSTGSFIDTAEAHGLTEALGLPLLERALRHVAQWRAEGVAVPTLHIGISRTLLLAPSTVDRLLWMLEDNRIEPGQIAVEVSERYCDGRSVEAVFANLRRLSGLGAAIVIDDFGSVDAALGNITLLGASKIKLNVARTRGLQTDDRSDDPIREMRMKALLPGIARIGESLDVQVMAKGVQDGARISSLLARGFAEMEGDAVAPAMQDGDAREWLKRSSPSHLHLVAG